MAEYKFLDYDGLKLFKELLEQELAGGGTTTISNAAVGTVQWFAGNDTPDGYLFCDGSELDRTTYSDLFNVIGTIYGEGDGSTTFAIPDLTDRMLQGSETSGSVFSAGAPEIYGEVYVVQNLTANAANNAFRMNNTSNTYMVGGTIGVYSGWAIFSANSYNSIYGASNTIQPPAISMRPCIKYT